MPVEMHDPGALHIDKGLAYLLPLKIPSSNQKVGRYIQTQEKDASRLLQL